MSNIVIAFPKAEIAQNIKRILAQSGYHISAVCTTGAAALQQVQDLDSGILICGYRFLDMHYTELYEYLPTQVQMIMVASAGNIMEREVDNLICLSMPLKVHELLETIQMMDQTIARRRKQLRSQPKQRSEEERELINRAKSILMERNSFSEAEAHRYIQKKSMDNGTGLVETAQMILSLMGDG